MIAKIEKLPTQKADIVFSSECRKHFPTFSLWLRYNIEQAMTEGNFHLEEEEINTIVEKNCFIKDFFINDIVFRIKIE